MIFNWFSKKNKSSKERETKTHPYTNTVTPTHFNYSWIITGKLAIGPMPRLFEDWELLENNGIHKRFSCCYPEEHIFVPIPEDWQTRQVSLPDHRNQEDLTLEKIVYALQEAIHFISTEEGPVYLHCFAGQERSSLMATGIVSLIENKDLFTALAWVRQCYPRAKPLYEHLDLLEKALQKYQRTEE